VPKKLPRARSVSPLEPPNIYMTARESFER
jgi:hypothetical protein